MLIAILRAVFGALSLEETGWVVAITGGASTLLTLLCTKGVDAWVKWRTTNSDEDIKQQKARAAQDMEDRKYEDSQEAVAFQQATAAYDKLVANFEARVKALENDRDTLLVELKETRKEHMACQVEQERLRGKLEALQVHVDRLWKHDEANKEHVASLETAIKKVEEGRPAP